ncbi:MAG: 23S rRNA (guanosine(2251)-2'-O)-methyltransferase RlmB [Mariprofundaceae bacterium]
MIAGIHAVKHALDAGDPLDELIIEKGKSHPRINELIHLAKKAKVRVSYLPKAALDRQADGAQHQGVLAREQTQAKLRFEAWLESLDMDDSPFVLLLDQVTDPHNLGACVRTAEAAGCVGVVIPRDHAADPDSPVVAKSACGALSRLPLLSVTNLSRSMKALQEKGFWLCGMAGEADDSLYGVDLKGGIGLVMGAEGKGLRRLVRENCDQLCKVPMPGHVESLNVSVASGVALFEAVRQRQG